MIERYTLPAMGKFWTETAKFQTWLDVELAVCEAQTTLGNIPVEIMTQIRQQARFDPQRIQEIEQTVRHDVIAFLTNLNESLGEAGRYVHLGLTSSDVLDTGLALQMVGSVEVLLAQVEQLIQVVRSQAQRHRHTVMVGRSHGIHAEPITFGFKLAGWLAELLRQRERLTRLRTQVAVGKISGAVGTYAHLDPRVEVLACQSLGLTPDCASTQVISRDRHAEYLQVLALLGGFPGAVCGGNSAFATDRGAGGGGIFRPRTKGVVRHAPQAQSHPFRAAHRVGTVIAGVCDCWFRKCCPLA